jgi:hypothetical protein
MLLPQHVAEFSVAVLGVGLAVVEPGEGGVTATGPGSGGNGGGAIGAGEISWGIGKAVVDGVIWLSYGDCTGRSFPEQVSVAGRAPLSSPHPPSLPQVNSRDQCPPGRRD